MLTRRDLLKNAAWSAAGAAAVAAAGCAAQPQRRRQLVNDVHSALNPTWVLDIARPSSLDELQALVRAEASRGGTLSIAGGRHAMGGQQFATDSTLIDMRGLDRILAFDAERGLIRVEGGIEWPALLAGYLELQKDAAGRVWGFAQKQTGADRISIAGSIACNAHGRGLTRPPLVDDVVDLTLVGADGTVQRASRDENPELFAQAVGGYGLFGVIYAATLRLVPRRKLERTVEVMMIDGLMPAFESRIAAGYLYGDFQFAIDPKSEDFLRRGVFSCYRPVDDATPMPPATSGQRELSDDDWRNLLLLAHADRQAAFDRYSRYYLTTNGQLYWSDTHQMSPYFDGYHAAIDRSLGTEGSEMITELYVPRPALTGFMAAVADRLRSGGDELIYGTIRLIERDAVTMLPWAREPYVCVIFNLHVPHAPEAGRLSARAFRDLIDLALERGGSYYLTYHRHATREQVLAAYPRFPELLERKLEADPRELFQSDWYRHYRRMFPAARGGGAGGAGRLFQ